MFSVRTAVIQKGVSMCEKEYVYTMTRVFLALASLVAVVRLFGRNKHAESIVA